MRSCVRYFGGLIRQSLYMRRDPLLAQPGFLNVLLLTAFG